MKFYELLVNEVSRETAECVSVSFAVPIDLKQTFTFVPGQYLTLQAEIEGVPVRRAYSICSQKGDELRAAIKLVSGGLFSTWANSRLKAGDRLGVAEPQGAFIHQVDSNASNNYVAFVVGSGITPVLSIMSHILYDEPQSTFTLFYGNKSIQKIIFKEEIEALKNRFLSRVQINYLLSQEVTDSSILLGRIKAENIDKYLRYFVPNKKVDKVFLCGPYEMIMSLRNELPKHGIDADKIKFELFFNPETEANINTKRKVEKLAFKQKIRVTLDGVTSELYAQYDMPLLDMAIESGLDLPFACKGGVCATCKAKVISGEAEMTTNFALEKEEVKAGYVLTCQTHIKSTEAEVSFDA